MEAPVARALLAALADSWPEGATLEQMVVRVRDGHVVVSVWTSTPGEVIGRRGVTAAELRDRLRAVVADAEVGVELEVHPASSGRDLVPDLSGMTVAEAHGKARAAGFRLVTADPDGVPISFAMANDEYARFVVVGQSPLPGVLAPLRSPIVVTVEERGGGGEAGDREPLVPTPPGGNVVLEHVLGIEDIDRVEAFEQVEDLGWVPLADPPRGVETPSPRSRRRGADW